MNIYYDNSLYSAKLETLKKIAQQEGAVEKIAQADVQVWSVYGELFTNEREAIIFAIEHKRHMEKNYKRRAV